MGARFTDRVTAGARTRNRRERAFTNSRRNCPVPGFRASPRVGIALALPPGMPRLAYTALAFSMLLYGCPDDSQPPDGDPVPPPPAQEPELAGLYHSVARWDLSSAITEHPGVGTVVADLIVEQVVSLSGVPAPLEDAAREQVAAAIHEPIRSHVDAQIPSDLLPDSPFLDELSAIFADVEVESDIDLVVAGSDADMLGGSETVTGMRLRRGDRVLILPVDALELGQAKVPVGALIDGSVDSDTGLTFDSHELALRIDVLLTYAAVELLDQLDAETLAEQVNEALACTSIVERITGGSSELTFEAGGMSFSVGVADLLDGCALARSEVAGYAFGLINPDVGVAVGGTARALDTNGDAVIDRLVSGADYSGLITAVPLPTPTRFNASFSAERAE